MSYYSEPAELKASGIDLADTGIDVAGTLGDCHEPTHRYGEAPGCITFEVAQSQGLIERIPESEWPERIEYLERHKATLQHRIDADWAGHTRPEPARMVLVLRLDWRHAGELRPGWRGTHTTVGSKRRCQDQKLSRRGWLAK